MQIILIGFMGSGKTEVSKKLGAILNLPLIELDELTLTISGRKSIKEIFELDGEGKFRELEQGALEQISGNFVLSSGGGTLLKKSGAQIIYLKTSFEVIEKRLKGKTDRPMFTENARKLYDERVNSYEKLADIIVLTDTLSATEVADEIIKSLNYAR